MSSNQINSFWIVDAPYSVQGVSGRTYYFNRDKKLLDSFPVCVYDISGNVIGHNKYSHMDLVPSLLPVKDEICHNGFLCSLYIYDEELLGNQKIYKNGRESELTDFTLDKCMIEIDIDGKKKLIRLFPVEYAIPSKRWYPLVKIEINDMSKVLETVSGKYDSITRANIYKQGERHYLVSNDIIYATYNPSTSSPGILKRQDLVDIPNILTIIHVLQREPYSIHEAKAGTNLSSVNVDIGALKNLFTLEQFRKLDINVVPRYYDVRNNANLEKYDYILSLAGSVFFKNKIPPSFEYNIELFNDRVAKRIDDTKSSDIKIGDIFLDRSKQHAYIYLDKNSSQRLDINKTNQIVLPVLHPIYIDKWYVFPPTYWNTIKQELKLDLRVSFRFDESEWTDGKRFIFQIFDTTYLVEVDDPKKEYYSNIVQRNAYIEYNHSNGIHVIAS